MKMPKCPRLLSIHFLGKSGIVAVGHLFVLGIGRGCKGDGARSVGGISEHVMLFHQCITVYCIHEFGQQSLSVAILMKKSKRHRIAFTKCCAIYHAYYCVKNQVAKKGE